MNDRRAVDVVIIGSGFAGIVAANRLADLGIDLLLVDENIHLGGQLLRSIPRQLGSEGRPHRDHVKRIGFRFIDSLKQRRVRVMNRTRVLGVFPGHELLLEEDEQRVFTVTPKIILLATGARERFLPFKGWTLPGVISTGAVQVLIKSCGVLPAREGVIAGSGLFLFSVAYEMLRHGARVKAVLEQTPMLSKAMLLGQVFHQWPKFAEGARFLSRIYLSGVPVRYTSQVIEARGNGRLQEVVIGRVDSRGNPIAGKEQVIPSGLLAVGNGFAANIELGIAAGCDSEFDKTKGGWVLRVGDDLETSQPGIFAAGEVTGIAGALKSITEGEIAALAIGTRLGKATAATYSRQMQRLTRQRAHHLRFGTYFNTLYGIPRAAYAAIPDETVICRCEDVTMGDIRQAVAAGYDRPEFLKVAQRVAMGDCQGRTCAPIVYDVLSELTGRPVHSFKPFSIRPPVKPATTGSLATWQKFSD